MLFVCEWDDGGGACAEPWMTGPFQLFALAEHADWSPSACEDKVLTRPCRFRVLCVYGLRESLLSIAE